MYQPPAAAGSQQQQQQQLQQNIGAMYQPPANASYSNMVSIWFLSTYFDVPFRGIVCQSVNCMSSQN